MTTNRSSDVYLLVVAAVGGLFLLAAGFAGYVVVRQRAAAGVAATATATPVVTPLSPPPLVSAAPVGCVTAPTVATATAETTATATATGTGTGTAASPKGKSTAVPQLRMGATTVSGRLAPEIIQRIVRQNYGRFRLCYENGLKSDPALEGKVAVRFVIGADGDVATASEDSSTTMSDKTVVACVVRSFSTLSFPKPEGGIVTVLYPLIFSPGA